MLQTPRSLRLLFALPLLSALPLFGQAGLGSVNGELVDPTGARLPHAAVRLVEQATQIANSTVTNEEGLFNFPAVVVGRYALSIKAPGFKDKQLSNLVVNAFQQLSLGQI